MSYDAYLEDGELTHHSWIRALRDGILLGNVCSDCDHVTAAPKAACTRCGCHDTEVVSLPTTGEVYAETTVFVPPERFTDKDSYGVALVDIGKARIMVHLDDEAAIGDTVELKGVIEADETPGPVFEPTT